MSENKVDIVVMGAMGRMGQMILASCAKESNAQVIGAVERPDPSTLNKTTGVSSANIQLTQELKEVLKPGAVIIDFTAPDATLANLKVAQEVGANIVIGTTGFSAEEKKQIEIASQKIGVVFSPNMSMGVNILFKAAEMVARSLGVHYDVEIVEAHHNQKKDSPSGTALGLLEAVGRGHKCNIDEVAVYGREGMVGARPRGEIGVHGVRGGDIVGDHTVLYAGDGERIELKHIAHSRATFANGSVQAALYLSGKEKGLYTMFDVLGLN